MPPSAPSASRAAGTEAKGGQILISSRVATAGEGLIEAEAMGSLALKGLIKPVPTFNVLGLSGTR